VTESGGAVSEVGAEGPDWASRGPEIVAALQRVLRHSSDERANGVDAVPRAAIVVSDGQELSADCINVHGDDADEHPD